MMNFQKIKTNKKNIFFSMISMLLILGAHYKVEAKEEKVKKPILSKNKAKGPAIICTLHAEPGIIAYLTDGKVAKGSTKVKDITTYRAGVDLKVKSGSCNIKEALSDADLNHLQSRLTGAWNTRLDFAKKNTPDMTDEQLVIETERTPAQGGCAMDIQVKASQDPKVIANQLAYEVGSCEEDRIAKMTGFTQRG